MRNVESKFRCHDHEGVQTRAMAQGATDEGSIRQRDRFFTVPQGRLKLRHLDGRAELIAYTRENLPVARPSEYAIFTTLSPEALEQVLSKALPAGPALEKRRHLLLCRHTRIHLDDVAGLGRFVEMETLVDELSDEEAQREHAELVAILGLESCERIAVGYVDLLEP